jgi:hypothetical protein
MTANNETPDLTPADGGRRSLSIELDDFALLALEEEAREMDVSVNELGAFALLYYLADRDSGRTARRLPRHQTDGATRATGGLRAR